MIEPEQEAVLERVNNLNSKATNQPNQLPDILPIIPITKRPFFPGMAAPIIFEPGPFFDVIKEVAKSSQKLVGLILSKNETQNIYEANFKDLYKVGVLAKILKIIPIDNGAAQVVFNMEKRFQITKNLAIQPNGSFAAKVKYFEEILKFDDELKAYSISIISTIKDLLKLNPLFKEELQIFLSHSDFTEPGKVADFAVALTTATREEQQKILETIDLKKRATAALKIIKKEYDLSVIKQNINQKIDAALNKNQREYFLKEQFKTIKKELGLEKDDKSIDLEKFKKRLEERKLTTQIQTTINEELAKLSALDHQSSEYSVVKNYLDWLTILPWGINSSDNTSLKVAEDILNRDHYGLNDIKERILEFISVGKLTGGIKGNIICLVGPPGVGKTSIGKSIANALGRKFYRFSVGGMRDEAEIKGHRRTYIGAMPGKIIQALKYCQTMNPVIMLDEIDKMGQSYHGDPASALLEVLDTEQNSEFLDHYLDVRCDLSNVLFIVTANVLDTIPGPLRDRMEVLRLSGYILEEKLQIAKKYLVPKNRKLVGLKSTQVSFNTDALKSIIQNYAREAGVRNFENLIKKILRKLSLKIVKHEELEGNKKSTIKKFNIDQKLVKELLGKASFTTDRYYEKMPAGVAMGLAWTAMGGATLYIESIKVPAEKSVMKLTGQAGDVMKESAEIAWTFLNGNLKKYAKSCNFFDHNKVHIHIPEGATPKDGPSAGITMVTSLLSLALNRPVKTDLGMTGELTLTGKVLPIGGVKEKIIAAKRSGLTEVILPIDNQKDFDELPSHIKKGIKINFATHYDDVFKIAFEKK